MIDSCGIDQTISIVTDTGLVASNLQDVLESEGYNVYQIFNTQMVRFDQCEEKLKPSRLWLVEINDEDESSDWLTYFFETPNLLVFFGDARGPSCQDNTSEIFTRWRRRFVLKIMSVLGKSVHIESIGSGTSASSVENTDAQPENTMLSGADMQNPEEEESVPVDCLNRHGSESERETKELDESTNSLVVDENIRQNPAKPDCAIEENLDVPTIKEIVEVPAENESLGTSFRVDSSKAETGSVTTLGEFINTKRLSTFPEKMVGDFSIWCIASSVGGPIALKNFLSKFDSDVPVAFVLIQHIEHRFLGTLIGVLEQGTTMHVKVAEHGDNIKPGTLLIIPAEPSLSISSDGVFYRSNEGWVGAYEPSADQIMDAMLNLKHTPDGAIVLTGMGNDGQMSAKKWVEQGIPVWAQDPETCDAPSMPGAIIDSNCASFVANPMGLANKLNDFFHVRKKTSDMA